ncbi:MAG: zinc ribbon domain-containing protein [Nitrospirales bacterium]
MPVYEYQCQSCEHKFELMQSVNTRPEDTSCPRCNETKANRLMSSFASQIKGEHKTGFREMKAYDMYNDRMDRFSKLPPLMGGARAMPSESSMGPPSDSGPGES